MHMQDKAVDITICSLFLNSYEVKIKQSAIGWNRFVFLFKIETKTTSDDNRKHEEVIKTSNRIVAISCTL